MEKSKQNAKAESPVKMTARLCNCSTDNVYKVLRGEHDNDEVMRTYKKIVQAREMAAKLIEQNINA